MASYREQKLEEGITLISGIMERMHYHAWSKYVEKQQENEKLIARNLELESKVRGLEAELLGIKDIGDGI